MQKLVYLMELRGVPAGYRFRLYNYGPYSGDLAGDVSYIEALEGVTVHFDYKRNVYKIAPGQESGTLIQKAPEFLRMNRSVIDHVIEQFGRRSARDLELLATTAYLHKQFVGHAFRREDLHEQVKAVKPRFSDTEVSAAIDELVKEGYVRA